MPRAIELTKGFVATVDDESYQSLIAHRWNYAKGYATRSINRSGEKRRTVYMHREVLDLDGKCKFFIDHINGDKLDNRKCNLRTCTQSQNQLNRSSSNAHGFKGVSFWRGEFRALLRFNGKRFFKGGFSTAEKAARCYDQFALEHGGEFPKLNFPRLEQR